MKLNNINLQCKYIINIIIIYNNNNNNYEEEQVLVTWIVPAVNLFDGVIDYYYWSWRCCC